MLAKTPVTQHSPCYSAVSASLVKPSPDCSNYSPFCHTLILRKPFKIVKTSRFIQVVTSHTQREWGKVIDIVYIGMFVDQKHTLAIDSPFQTFTVGLLAEFID